MFVLVFGMFLLVDWISVAEVLIEKFSCGNGGFWGEIPLDRPEKKMPSMDLGSWA